MAEITQIDLGLVVGDTGATGATGPTGPQGPGATISVGSVTTTTYGNPAQVTNSGTATDAVLDFVIPHGAPGEEVTDVSSLTLNSITETAASFPVPAVGDVMSVAMGKVKKFFADTVAALNTKLNKANVVNDLTYTTSGYALDARAGKTLKTQIDSLNDSLPRIERTLGQLDGTAFTYHTLTTPMKNYLQREIVGCCTGGQHGDAVILNIIPESSTSIRVSWSKNLTGGGSVGVTFVYY